VVPAGVPLLDGVAVGDGDALLDGRTGLHSVEWPCPGQGARLQAVRFNTGSDPRAAVVHLATATPIQLSLNTLPTTTTSVPVPSPTTSAVSETACKRSPMLMWASSPLIARI
jgi:hypothetical protein